MTLYIITYIVISIIIWIGYLKLAKYLEWDEEDSVFTGPMLAICWPVVFPIVGFFLIVASFIWFLNFISKLIYNKL